MFTDILGFANSGYNKEYILSLISYLMAVMLLGKKVKSRNFLLKQQQLDYYNALCMGLPFKNIHKLKQIQNAFLQNATFFAFAASSLAGRLIPDELIPSLIHK